MKVTRGFRVCRQVCLRLSLAMAVTSAAICSSNAADDSLCGGTNLCGDLGLCGESCTSESYTGPLSGPVDPEDPIVPETMEPIFEPTTQADALFAGGVEGTLTSPGHAPGYIDWAVPQTHFRMRFDAGFDSNRPDRAEFFYAQYQVKGPGDLGNNILNDSVDFQEIRSYFELASDNDYSVFVEIPVRFLQTSAPAGARPTGDANGLGDIEAGFKYALSKDPSHFLSFQLKTYIPTGNASDNLGTNHVAIEPGLLFNSRVNSRLDVFGEVRDWIPVNGSTLNGRDYAGNVLRYGVGAAYTAMSSCSVDVSPVVEFVGWSVLDGQVFDAVTTRSRSARTTIVNAKVGVRTLFKKNGNTLYVGYGNALTGQRWYENFLRVEYTVFM